MAEARRKIRGIRWRWIDQSEGRICGEIDLRNPAKYTTSGATLSMCPYQIGQIYLIHHVYLIYLFAERDVFDLIATSKQIKQIKQISGPLCICWSHWLSYAMREAIISEEKLPWTKRKYSVIYKEAVKDSKVMVCLQWKLEIGERSYGCRTRIRHLLQTSRSE